ncbi:hypothetical protein INT45_000245 [Circinella minor]|uniref:Uncharacterized protein n=1 Tax=Circinella minor TaxID=1195481 RepID=A0A8H7S2X1_9FUNG|nr:hypothetical protein INT45_000245 [Circinella minor]
MQDTGLLISQYLSNVPHDKWDIYGLLDIIIENEPTILNLVIIGKVKRSLLEISIAKNIKKGAMTKATKLLGQWDNNFNKNIMLYIQEKKFKPESSQAKTPSLQQQPLHQQDHSQPRNSQENNDQQGHSEAKNNVTVIAKKISGSTIVTDSTIVVDPSSSQEDTKGKKRKSLQRDKIDDLFNPTKRASTETARSFSEFLAGQQHDGNAIHEKNHVVIIKDNRTHRINCPSNILESPHRPKVEPATIEGISEYVVMAGSSIACSNQAVQNKYEQNKIDQKNNSSLEAFPCIKDFLKTILSIPFEDFPRILWSTNINTNDEKSVMMMKIIQYTLTSFHLHCINPSEETSHERTFFVNLVIPAFRALEKVTGLVKYHWCEKQLLANKLVYLKMGSESSNKNGNRLMDGLASMCDTPSKMESVLMEASSGNDCENVPHTLGDTIKLLECSTNSLLVESKNYKDASYEAFKNLKVNTIHTIKNEITLNQVSVLDSSRWQSIQVRTCKVPNTWAQRSGYAKYFELIATIVISLFDAKDILEKLGNEHNGLSPFEGQSISEALIHQHST